MRLQLRADDRVLLLGIPETAVLAAMARILVRGVLVAMGPPASVDRARRDLAEFDNVMLLDREPARIPWRDAYFTKIVTSDTEPASECRRVLAPGGEIVAFASAGLDPI